MLNISIDSTDLIAELNGLADRLSKVPSTKVIDRTMSDPGRSAARVVVPQSWREYYDTDTPEDSDDIEW